MLGLMLLCVAELGLCTPVASFITCWVKHNGLMVGTCPLCNWICKFCILEVKVDKLLCLWLVLRSQYGKSVCGMLLCRPDSWLSRDDDNLLCCGCWWSQVWTCSQGWQTRFNLSQISGDSWTGRSHSPSYHLKLCFASCSSFTQLIAELNFFFFPQRDYSCFLGINKMRIGVLKYPASKLYLDLAGRLLFTVDEQ